MRWYDRSRNPIPYSPEHKNHLPFGYDENGGKKPYRRTLVDRVILRVLLLLPLAYFAYVIWIDDLPIPHRRSDDASQLHGAAIWLLLGAYLCFVAYRLLFPSNGSTVYSSMKRPYFLPSDFMPTRGGKAGLVLACAGWLLFSASVFVHFFFTHDA